MKTVFTSPFACIKSAVVLGTVVCCAVAAQISAQPSCITPPSGLVGWWKGDGNALDSAGTNNGTLGGNVTYGSGEVGQGFVLDGSGDLVTVGNPTNLQLQNFTIEAWIQRGSTAIVSHGSYGIAQIFGYGQNGYGLLLTPAGNVELSLVGTDAASAGPAIVDTGFHHVAVTKTGSAVVVYIDGVAYPTAAYARTFSFTTVAAIGARGDNLDNSFLGTIDEVSVYNRALAAGEIQAIYNAGAAGKCVAPVAPLITTQPTSQTVTVGATVNFNAAASGTMPLSYQWSFNGSNIAGANTTSLTLSNVQASQSGTYAVVVTNVAGSATSSNAVLTVNFAPAIVQVVNANAASGSTAVVPVVLVANGNENALGFTLNFPTSSLAYAQVDLGSGLATATLLVNHLQAANGKLGVALALPTGSTFAAGTQALVSVVFTTAIATSNTTAAITFGDSPIVRQLTDALGNPQPANYVAGTVSIAAVAYEGDVWPRPGGDQLLTIADWVLVGRYAAHLDYPTNASEFQRADCAPRATLGNGHITVSDWVQAGRYAAGLDPLTVAGGPTSEALSQPHTFNVGANNATARQLQVGNAVLAQNQSGVVRVTLAAQGNENALGFALTFDPTVFSYVGATLGSDATGAALNVNASQAGSGQVGFVLALPAGTSFATGTREILKVTLQAAPGAKGDALVSFTSQPVTPEVSDPTAQVLAANYVNATVTVNPPPSLNITPAGQSVMLSWPLWASNFVPQSADAILPTVAWTNVSATASVSNNENVVTLPVTGAAKFYRLSSP